MAQTKKKADLTWPARTLPSWEKSLEYLLLSAEDRMKWRVNNSISLLEWYKSLAPEPLEGEWMAMDDACEAIGMTRMKFFPLDKKSYFGKTSLDGRKKMISTVRVNELRKQEAYLVPVAALCQASERERWYMGRVFIDQLFKKLYTSVADKRQRFVTIGNAARIIHHGRKRRAMIEEWKTLHDLNKESGLNLPDDRLMYRYREMKKQGKVTLASVNVYGGRPIKGFGGHEYKLSPHEYKRMLVIEKANVKAIKIGLTPPQIAKQMGISLPNVEQYIQIGAELGFLQPFEIASNTKTGYKRFVLWPHDAERVISGELNLPSAIRYRRLRGEMSIAEIRKLVLEESEPSVTVENLAEKMGITTTTVSGLIRAGKKLGMLHPTGFMYEGSYRPFKYRVTPEEAELLASGKLPIPGEKTLEKIMKSNLVGKRGVMPSIDDAFYSDEQRFIEEARAGNKHTLNILLKMYEPAVEGLAKRYKFGSMEERVEFFSQAFKESVTGTVGYLPRIILIHLMNEKGKERRGRTQYPRWHLRKSLQRCVSYGISLMKSME